MRIHTIHCRGALDSQRALVPPDVLTFAPCSAHTHCTCTTHYSARTGMAFRAKINCSLLTHYKIPCREQLHMQTPFFPHHSSPRLPPSLPSRLPASQFLPLRKALSGLGPTTQVLPAHYCSPLPPGVTRPPFLRPCPPVAGRQTGCTAALADLAHPPTRKAPPTPKAPRADVCSRVGRATHSP